MHLLVGLGNPGNNYSKNRHNIGFIILDEIAAHYGASNWQKKISSFICDINVEGQKCILIKPQTFMNLSGDGVIAAASFYKIKPEQITVIHDELDLPFAKVKLKKGGGHGGHNGLRSITGHIGADYNRLRIGIGRPEGKHQVSNYVLSNFSNDQMQPMETLASDIAKALPHLLSGHGGKFIEAITPSLSPGKKTKKTDQKQHGSTLDKQPENKQTATDQQDEQEQSSGLADQLKNWLKGSK